MNFDVFNLSEIVKIKLEKIGQFLIIYLRNRTNFMVSHINIQFSAENVQFQGRELHPFSLYAYKDTSIFCPYIPSDCEETSSMKNVKASLTITAFDYEQDLYLFHQRFNVEIDKSQRISSDNPIRDMLTASFSNNKLISTMKNYLGSQKVNNVSLNQIQSYIYSNYINIFQIYDYKQDTIVFIHFGSPFLIIYYYKDTSCELYMEKIGKNWRDQASKIVNNMQKKLELSKSHVEHLILKLGADLINLSDMLYVQVKKSQIIHKLDEIQEILDCLSIDGEIPYLSKLRQDILTFPQENLPDLCRVTDKIYAYLFSRLSETRKEKKTIKIKKPQTISDFKLNHESCLSDYEFEGLNQNIKNNKL